MASAAALLPPPLRKRRRPGSVVPIAVAVFPTDVAVRPFADRVHNVVRWSEFDRGGHFAALEAPDVLIADVRDFFGGLNPQASQAPPTVIGPR